VPWVNLCRRRLSAQINSAECPTKGPRQSRIRSAKPEFPVVNAIFMDIYLLAEDMLFIFSKASHSHQSDVVLHFVPSSSHNSLDRNLLPGVHMTPISVLTWLIALHRTKRHWRSSTTACGQGTTPRSAWARGRGRSTGLGMHHTQRSWTRSEGWRCPARSTAPTTYPGSIPSQSLPTRRQTATPPPLPSGMSGRVKVQVAGECNSLLGWHMNSARLAFFLPIFSHIILFILAAEYYSFYQPNSLLCDDATSNRVWVPVIPCTQPTGFHIDPHPSPVGFLRHV
jgi:hypothetical protein